MRPLHVALDALHVPWWAQPNMAMSPRERRNRAVEAATIKLAYLIPKRLAYWCCIRVGVNATVGRYSNQVVPELTFLDVLKRWDETHGHR